MNEDLKVRVDKVKEWVKILDERKQGAQDRLKEYGENEAYFIVLNAKIQGRSDIGDKGYIDGLDCPIYDTGVTAAFGGSKAALTLLTFAPAIWTQVVIDKNKFKDDNEIETYVRRYISLLSIITSNEMLLLCSSDRPFDALDAYENSKGILTMIDTTSKVYNFYKDEVTLDDLKLASDHIELFIELLKNKSYDVAVEAFFSSHHTVIPRLMLANIWLGIEGLIGVDAELTFRLSLLISFFLKDDGESRRGLYRDIKSLYGVRSKAVHGSTISDQKILECYINSRNILRLLIIRCLMISKVPKTSEFEDYVFWGVSPAAPAAT